MFNQSLLEVCHGRRRSEDFRLSTDYMYVNYSSDVFLNKSMKLTKPAVIFSKNTVKKILNIINTVKCSILKSVKFYFNTFLNVIYSCDAKLKASLLQSSVSHDPSEITIIC